MSGDGGRRPVVLVSGLSGAGKSSILRTLEDLGFEAIDNPPLDLVEALADRAERPLAIGVDARTSGFDAGAVLASLARLRANPALEPTLLFARADETVLLRRFTETRRRHPMARVGSADGALVGSVADGVAEEVRMTAALAGAAELVLDTTELTPPALRRVIEQRFGGAAGVGALMVSLVSFAYPAGLPREADLVLDARFLRNPHYDPTLRSQTGLEPAVADYVEQDPDFNRFLDCIAALLTLLLPRFVAEGKKYATVAVGCTGGRHRSVHVVERLAASLAVSHGPAGSCRGGLVVSVTHRELARQALVRVGRHTDLESGANEGV